MSHHQVLESLGESFRHLRFHSRATLTTKNVVHQAGHVWMSFVATSSSIKNQLCFRTMRTSDTCSGFSDSIVDEVMVLVGVGGVLLLIELRD